MDTPPSRTAATTDSSRPLPLSARALANRRVQYTPANAETMPHRTYSQNLVRLTLMPAKVAASALLPMAYNPRPIGVAYSTIANAMASTAATRMAQGMGVPGIGAIALRVQFTG